MASEYTPTEYTPTEYSSLAPEPPPYPNSALLVNFSWKKFQILVTEEHRPSVEAYSISIRTTFGPHVILKSIESGATLGTGTLHAFSINPDIVTHGHAGKLNALKRFKTEYTHQSHAYSDSDTPVPMTWKSSSGFTSWDFVCVDALGIPAARFTATHIHVSKVARIEFMGPRAESVAAREELLLVGMTLYYCMVSRTYNVFNIFGSILTPAGQKEKDKAEENSLYGLKRGEASEEQYGPKLNVVRRA
jgi:hypothetical protein